MNLGDSGQTLFKISESARPRLVQLQADALNYVVLVYTRGQTTQHHISFVWLSTTVYREQTGPFA